MNKENTDTSKTIDDGSCKCVTQSNLVSDVEDLHVIAVIFKSDTSQANGVTLRFPAIVQRLGHFRMRA